MVQDYKNTAGKRAPKKSGLPRWAVLLILLIVAAFVTFLYFLNQKLPVASNPLEIIKPRSDVRIPNQAEVKPEPSEATTEQPASPKFEFYNVLPELEVVLPQVKNVLQPLLTKPLERPKAAAIESKVEVAPATAKLTPVVANKSTTSRYFQVGSFKRRGDAERRQVELILLGLEAKIQSARIKGVTWYRVRFGPYDSAAKIARIKTKLRKNRVDFLLIKG
ncbi:MAG: SPOR domain-containing protein [Gammaproteobacteria bacterium]|nr:SPOR domain-containing protein [Gammaproteobacteria bacterium]